MNSLTVSVIGPYRSGKSTLVNKLQQRKGAEEDVSFFFFKYGGKNVTLIDTPGDMDNPTTLASVLTLSDAIIFCVSPENGVNLQVGEQIIMASSIGIKHGLICITKADISTSEDISKLEKQLSAIIKGTSMENFEITVIDINNDQSMADIRAKVSNFPYSQENIEKPFKIFIDHAFESKGMSVAVGTMPTGKIGIHSEGVIAPAPFTKDISINSIQINQEDFQSAEAGDRVGVAIKGVWPWDLPRGVEIRKKGSFKDINEGDLTVDVSPLYKQEIKDDVKLNLILNWQNLVITLSNVKHENNKLTAHFVADKNFCFDENDKMILINKDLPIRFLRVVGKTAVM
ncbi:MAG: GTP-binding protein [Candidatus Parvarchaeota archaeon]|jgi:selenocysteine-specific elongation factor|nr:GTP-binding protein [Candidatus Parvarchaeota archaeon]